MRKFIAKMWLPYSWRKLKNNKTAIYKASLYMLVKVHRSKFLKYVTNRNFFVITNLVTFGSNFGILITNFNLTA